MKSLLNKRILVCSKGGSGKSSIVSLLGNELQQQIYKVILLDADASNPGGLFCFLTDKIKAPVPLIEFFGGKKKSFVLLMILPRLQDEMIFYL